MLSDNLDMKLAKEVMGDLYDQWAIAHVLQKPERHSFFLQKKKEIASKYQSIIDDIQTNRGWNHPTEQESDIVTLSPHELYSNYQSINLGIPNEVRFIITKILPEDTPREIIDLIMYWAAIMTMSHEIHDLSSVV